MPEKSKPTKAGAKSAAKIPSKPAPKIATPAPTVKITKGDTGGNKAIVTRKTRPAALIAHDHKAAHDSKAAHDHKPASKAKAKALPVLPSSERAALVAREAYFMAERRAFSVGNDLADWLEAERIVDEGYQFT